MFKKEYQVPGSRVLLLLAVLFFSALSTSVVLAQADTLRIGTVTGDPGQQVDLNIYLGNQSVAIGGFQLVLSYNTNALSTTRSNIIALPRAASLRFGSSIDADTIYIAGYDDSFSNPVQPGFGDIVQIQFTIGADVPGGDYYVRFVPRSVNPAYNTLSDRFGNARFPVLIDGYVRVTGPGNNPPVYTPALVSPRQVQVGSTLQFSVTATDSDGDEVMLSATGLPDNSTFAGNSGQGEVSSTFYFTPASSQNNNSYDVVFTASDGYAETRGTVTIDVGTVQTDPPPIINDPGSQNVAEGGHLEFTVSAYDPENQYVTLTATGVPTNASFEGTSGSGTISSVFSFDPDYNQNGVYNVVFRAEDTAGSFATRTVTINVVDAINDLLSVAALQGALPGSLDRSLIVNMQNPNPIYAIQFDVLYDPLVIDIKDAKPDSSRAFNYNLFQNSLEDGRYRVGILPLDLDTIPAGNGPIVEFVVDVDGAALPGPSVISFDSTSTVQDTAGTSVEMIFDEGSFTIDILGDANLDGVLSLGDCVAVLAYNIGRLEMSVRTRDAGDYNRDGDVRVSDLQGILWDVFNWDSPAPPLVSDAGSVELRRDYIYAGYSGEIPLWLDLSTEAGAVQFTIEYDPEEVIINDITPGEMISNLNLEYNDMTGEIRGVIYTYSFTEFGPAMGELVNLDIDIIGDNIDPASVVRLTDFEIVTVDAYRLNVDVIGELPIAYELYQNYPNPFNAKTTISFDLPYNSVVQVVVYNVLGQEIKEIQSGYLNAGHHQMIWDGTGSDGEEVTSGVYFYRVSADDFNKTKKMLLVK